MSRTLKETKDNDVVVTSNGVRVRNNRRKNGKTAAIIALSILLGLSLIFGITAAFFSANQQASGNVTLGDPVNINITQGGTSVSALTFDGTAMPGTVYDQIIGISMPADTSDAVLRGKLTLTNDQGISSNVEATVNTTDWTLNEADGYYYYNGIARATETKDFVTQITVPTSLTNADANKVYAITVQVEAIQYANGAASEVWTQAPAEWLSSYGTGA